MALSLIANWVSPWVGNMSTMARPLIVMLQPVPRIPAVLRRR